MYRQMELQASVQVSVVIAPELLQLRSAAIICSMISFAMSCMYLACPACT